LDIVPKKMLNSFQNASQEQAKNIMNNAMQMAGQYLKNMKSMAGGSPEQPMRTMAKEQMDINNALNKVGAYMGASGKVPEMDYLKMIGLQNTLGPIAGQKTHDTQQAEKELALRWANQNSSGSSGGLTPYQLFKYQLDQQEKFDKDVRDWTDRILEETSPKNIDITGTGVPIEYKNKFYHEGAGGKMHAFPEAALKAYKPMMGEDVYNEVAKRIRGYYGYEGDTTKKKDTSLLDNSYWAQPNIISKALKGQEAKNW